MSSRKFDGLVLALAVPLGVGLALAAGPLDLSALAGCGAGVPSREASVRPPAPAPVQALPPELPVPMRRPMDTGLADPCLVGRALADCAARLLARGPMPRL